MTIKKAGSKFEVMSKTTGKPLSKPMSKKAAVHREKQIQYFKNDAQYQKDHGGKHIPLTKKKGK
jgi:hypothetical protein